MTTQAWKRTGTGHRMLAPAAVAAVIALVATAGCTFSPQGEAALRRQADAAGRPFASSPQQRHPPRLPAVPTPRQLVARALIESPDVEAAYWQWRAAIEEIPQQGTEPTVPMLGATIGLQSGATSAAGTMLQLANMSSAPIEWPIKPLTQARAALQRAYAAGWNYRRAQFAVRRDTLDAWYKLAADTEMIGLLRQDERLLDELDAFARARIETGATSATTALSIEDERTELRARIVSVTARLPADRADLNRILGRSVRRTMGVPDRFPRHPAWRRDMGRILAQAVRRNPDLAALRREIRADRFDIERARLDYLPDFTLSLAASLDGVTQNPGGGIMFPIVAYQGIDAAIRQSRDWLRQTRAQLRSRRLGIAADLVADLMLLDGDERRIRLYETELLPRLRRMAAFAHTDVAQDEAPSDEPVRIERLRIQAQETILDLRLDAARRAADVDALTAARL